MYDFHTKAMLNNSYEMYLRMIYFILLIQVIKEEYVTMEHVTKYPYDDSYSKTNKNKETIQTREYIDTSAFVDHPSKNIWQNSKSTNSL